MNSNDNLQRALKKAFEDHKEPLREAQWDRLNAELEKEPRKKRFLPWFFISFAILLMAVAIGFWFGKNTNTTASSHENNQSVVAKSLATAEDTLIHNGQLNTTNQFSDSNTLSNSNTSNNALANKVSSQASTPSGLIGNNKPELGAEKSVPSNGKDIKNNKPTKASIDILGESGTGNLNTSNAGGTKPVVEKVNEKGSEKVTSVQPDKGSNTMGSNGDNAKPNTQLANTANDSDAKNGETKIGSPIHEKPKVKVNMIDTNVNAVWIASIDSANQTKEDSLNKKGGKKGGKNNGATSQISRFAVGFSTGFGSAVFKVKGFTNASTIHKDAEYLFNQSNANSKANHVNFNFEWFPFQKFGLGFSSGFQYRSISQTINMNYKFNEVPFRDTNSNIVGYVFIPDSSKPMVYHLQSVNKLNYINIPLRLMMTIPINPKNEFLVSAGLNLSFMAKAKGQDFSVNTTEFRSLKSFYQNKVNLGWTIGMQYSYNIYQKWWLGAEAQYQQNQYKYFVDYGVIKSKIKITNYNICVRYKF